MGEGIAIVRYVLLAFAGIALFVGSFVIFNTLSITVAQRMRELATLVDDRRFARQVLGAVLLEGDADRSRRLADRPGGRASAKLLDGMFASAGMELPQAGIVFAWRTVVVSLAADLGHGCCHTPLPALRATRVPPIAAVRGGGSAAALAARARAGRARGTAILAGIAVLAFAALTDAVATTPRLLLLATGAVLLFVGVNLAREVVSPLSFALGKPIEAVTGAAARSRKNSKRDPGQPARSRRRRSPSGSRSSRSSRCSARGCAPPSATRSSSRSRRLRRLRRHHAVDPGGGRKLRATPGVTAASVRAGNARAFEEKLLLTGVDPALIARFYHFEWEEGSSAAVLRGLDGSG